MMRSTLVICLAGIAIMLTAMMLSATWGLRTNWPLTNHGPISTASLPASANPAPSPDAPDRVKPDPQPEVADMGHSKSKLPTPEQALPGRDQALAVPDTHFVNHHPLQGDFPGMERAMFGMGCFWGAERLFWNTEGVYSTAVGYAGGSTKNPLYEEVCSGATGHAEVVLVIFDPQKTSYEQLLKVFWENHDPTQGMRQGADHGTQYRSTIYCYSDDQFRLAKSTRDQFQTALMTMGFGTITTEIEMAPPFYYAEDYHQQYLGKKPWGYCGLAGTGATCPIGLKVSSTPAEQSSSH